MTCYRSLNLVITICSVVAACSKFETKPRGSAPSFANMASESSGQTSKRIFYTSKKYTADLGGLAGADAKCADAAKAAKLGGRWVAWLSDSQHDAIDRVQGDGPWVDLGTNTVIFPTKASLKGRTSIPFGHDEFGASMSVWYFAAYWTGTDIGGRSSGQTCKDWRRTDSEERGTWGAGAVPRFLDDGKPEDGWTALQTQDCLGDARLLCFEQS